MIRFSREKDMIDTARYDELLNERGYIFYNRTEANRLNEIMKERLISLNSFISDEIKYGSGLELYGTEKGTIIDYLIEYKSCPESAFSLRGRQNLSLDQEKVLKPLLERGYATEFINMYMLYKSLKSRSSNINSIIKTCRGIDAVDNSGNQISKIPFKASEQINRRFNYRGYDIISQVSNEFKKTICADEGYYLAFGDFAQSDVRVAYNLLLRDKSNYDIMTSVDDFYEGIARLVCRDNGVIFNPVKFSEEREKYKVHTLSVLYGSNKSMKSDSSFVNSLNKLYERSGRYREFKEALDSLYEFGEVVHTISYFNHMQQIKCFNNSRYSFVNCGLNQPVQTGTSEVVILTVCKILDMFYNLGYSSDQVSVYFVRHDEPVFRVRKDVKDLWVFKEVEDILVDDWTPLKLKFSFGYNYSVKDKDLMLLANKNYEKNKDKISEIKYNDKCSSAYFPVKRIGKLYYHMTEFNGGTVICIQSKELKKIELFLVKSQDTDVVRNSVLSHINEIIQTHFKKYGYILVYSNFIDGSSVCGDKSVKYKKVQCLDLYDAQAFTESAINKMAGKVIFVEKEIKDKKVYTPFREV